MKTDIPNSVYRNIAAGLFFCVGLISFSCSGSDPATKDDGKVEKIISPNDTLMFNDSMIHLPSGADTTKR